MSKIARLSTAAFLAGVTTLAVTLPMPATARPDAQSQSGSLPVLPEPTAKSE